jgi:hypothetical protein
MVSLVKTQRRERRPDGEIWKPAGFEKAAGSSFGCLTCTLCHHSNTAYCIAPLHCNIGCNIKSVVNYCWNESNACARIGILLFMPFT